MAAKIDVAQIGPSSYAISIDGAAADTSAADVKDALYPLTAQPGAHVLVDLGTFSFVDADLVGILTGAAHLLRATGGELTLVTRDPRARRLFVDSGLDDIARVEATLAKGLDGGNAH
jgi:anti-anti-sigma factor